MAGCPTTAFTTPFVEMVANFLNLSLLLLLGACEVGFAGPSPVAAIGA